MQSLRKNYLLQTKYLAKQSVIGENKKEPATTNLHPPTPNLHHHPTPPPARNHDVH